MHNYSDVLTIAQLSAEEFGYLLSSAAVQRTVKETPLAGKNLALVFEKPSLRTRVTFEVAIRQLGGYPIILGSEVSRLGERETISDVARNLSLWVDGIVARMRDEMEDGARAACIATGGMADVLAGETTAIQRVEPDLTLQGLRIIWQRNQ